MLPRRPYRAPGAPWPLRQLLIPSRRPLPLRSGVLEKTRWVNTARESSPNYSIGTDDSGHITTESNESILFFGNLIPLRLSPLVLWRGGLESDRGATSLLKRFNSSALGPMDPINMVKRAIPPSLPIKVTGILPSLKDGGAFVKFKHDRSVSPKEIERQLIAKLEDNRITPWFNPLRSITARLVQGVPWLEDLYRFPKSRLRVEFVPPSSEGTAVELSQEQLYSLFRKYGKISEIESQASDSKIVPRYAYVDFASTRDAIMARNCLHGFVMDAVRGGGMNGTRLRLSYEKKAKSNYFWDWIKGHPRVVIPALAALLAAITVAVFDPIRTFFVKIHVQQTLKLSNSRLYRWFKSQTSDLLPPGLGGRKDDVEKGLGKIWEHRRDVITKLQGWLMETAETVIVITGPRGSGKKELVMDQALEDRQHVLLLDVKRITEARGESETIRKLAVAVGYRPVFSWANNLSSLIDLAVQSTTGVKSGFSETLESQIGKILHTTAVALKLIALSTKEDSDVDRNLSDDAYLEAHPEKRPVVVVDNFLNASTVPGNGYSGEEGSSTVVNDKIAEWAAGLVANNVAHVIVLTADGGAASKTLAKAMPDRVFRGVALGDLSPEVAMKFVLGHLGEGAVGQEKKVDEATNTSKSDQEKEPHQSSGSSSWLALRPSHPEAKPTSSPSETEQSAIAHAALVKELQACIPVLGGRLTDLQFLARRLRAGQSPQKAVQEIISQASSEVLKAFLLPKKRSDSDKWTPEQAWALVARLAADPAGVLRYNALLADGTLGGGLNPAGASPEDAIEALAAAELVSLDMTTTASDGVPGRPTTVRPGRPVYKAAFELLRRDAALRARMELAVLGKQIAGDVAAIKGAEDELECLARAGSTKQMQGRARYLLGKMEAAQKQLEEKERKAERIRAELRRCE